MKTHLSKLAESHAPDRAAIARTILEMTRFLGPEKSICPSEVARHLAPQGWRTWMQTVREEAGQLQRQGKLRITQKGQDVRMEDLRGPIRLSAPQSND